MSQLTAELFEMQPFFDTKLQQAKTACFDAFQNHVLQNETLQNRASFARLAKQDYKLAYQCGLVIWDRIDKDLKRHNSKLPNVFALWEHLANESKQGLLLDINDFVTALTPHLSPPLARDIKALNFDETFDVFTFIE